MHDDGREAPPPGAQDRPAAPPDEDRASPAPDEDRAPPPPDADRAGEASDEDGDREATAEEYESPDPTRKIVYLMVFRTGLITVLFGVIIGVGLLSRLPFRLATTHSQAMFALVIFAYGCSLLYAALYRHIRDKRRFFAIQVGVDVLLVSALVHLTGGVNSVYSFLFPLLIIEATIVFYRQGTLVTTVTVLVFFVAVAVGGWIRLLPPVPDQLALPWQATPPELARYLILNIGGQVCIAVLASFLAEQLRRADERVLEQRMTIRDIIRLNANILQSLQTGLITVDTQGTIMSANRAATALLGTTQNQLTARHVGEVLPSLADAARHTDPNRHRTSLARGGDAEPIPVEVTVSPLWDRDARRSGSLVLIEDLTEIHEMEERMKRAERLAAVGRLAAGVAHEIRNPLASVSGSLELLVANDDCDEEDRRLMGIALREVERLDALISSLLDYARPRSLHPIDFDLAEMAREVGAACAQDPVFEGVVVDVREPEGPCRLRADPSQLRQVLWNLYRNGAQAMDSAGRLEVEVLCEPRADPPGVRVRVTDHGPGIPPGQLSQIFEPFFTTKDRGTGLGLATVYRIVEDHRGTIEVESRPEGGTTFTVIIPDGGPTPAPG